MMVLLVNVCLLENVKKWDFIVGVFVNYLVWPTWGIHVLDMYESICSSLMTLYIIVYVLGHLKNNNVCDVINVLVNWWLSDFTLFKGNSCFVNECLKRVLLFGHAVVSRLIDIKRGKYATIEWLELFLYDYLLINHFIFCFLFQQCLQIWSYVNIFMHYKWCIG